MVMKTKKPTWAKKTKKKKKKLKELSLLQETEKKKVWLSSLPSSTFSDIITETNLISMRRQYTPEGFVNWSIPTDEGTGGEEDEPEDGEAKARAVGGVLTEVGQ